MELLNDGRVPAHQAENLRAEIDRAIATQGFTATVSVDASILRAVLDLLDDLDDDAERDARSQEDFDAGYQEALEDLRGYAADVRDAMDDPKELKVAVDELLRQVKGKKP